MAIARMLLSLRGEKAAKTKHKPNKQTNLMQIKQ